LSTFANNTSRNTRNTPLIIKHYHLNNGFVLRHSISKLVSRCLDCLFSLYCKLTSPWWYQRAIENITTHQI
jgi:hypothetical protein